MARTEYGVTITMDAETVGKLAASGNFLYGFAAVECSDAAGQPLVWLQNRGYSATTTVRWTAAYHAYTSTSTGSLAPGTQVSAGFSAAIEEGQTLAVDQAGGIGTVKAKGCPGAISMLNTRPAPLTCGVSLERGDGSLAGVCAVPLYGEALQIIRPLPSVLFLFATQNVPMGTVPDIATGEGVLVDVAEGSTRALSFGINTGWSWGDATWGTRVRAGSPLKPLLVSASPGLMKQAHKAASSWGF